jgi:hypothetical protein
VSYMKAVEPAIPFGMLIDSENIQVFRGGETPSQPIISLKTGEVLRRYEPEYGREPIFETYLAALVEAWLRDLASNWDSAAPPGREPLASVGLLPLLEGGTIRREVRLDRSPLH